MSETTSHRVAPQGRALIPLRYRLTTSPGCAYIRVDPPRREATMEAESACDARAGGDDRLNQHWTSGSPRRPAVVHSPRPRTRESLKQA